MDSLISVTVLCTTYNHAKYIRECLEGFVSQETSFKYKVIVHDDCSTDGTAEIVREYAKNYPDLIVPVLQKKNLYSLGIDRDKYILPLLEGRYIATCEGDDYWCDAAKLQRQYDYMEKHPEASLCTHAVKVYDEARGLFEGSIAPGSIERDFSTEEILVSVGDIFGTNSNFFRTKYYCRPKAYLNWGIGDWPRTIYLSTVGKVHYFPETMSVYRRNVPGSWSNRQQDGATRKKTLTALLDGLNRADQDTGGTYQSAFEAARFLVEKEYYIEARDWKALKRGDVGKRFRSCSLREKSAAWLKCHMPPSLLSYAVFLGRRIRFWKASTR